MPHSRIPTGHCTWYPAALCNRGARIPSPRQPGGELAAAADTITVPSSQNPAGLRESTDEVVYSGPRCSCQAEPHAQPVPHRLGGGTKLSDAETSWDRRQAGSPRASRPTHRVTAVTPALPESPC